MYSSGHCKNIQYGNVLRIRADAVAESVEQRLPRVEGRDVESQPSQSNDLYHLYLSLMLGINRIGKHLVSTISG